MSLLAAIAVTFRVIFNLIAGAMLIGWWQGHWAVLSQKRGWQAHLSNFVVTAIASGIAFGSLFNVFPDAGWHIPETVRLAGLNAGMAVILVGLLTALYRRALRAGPEKARAAFLCGFALVIPAAGFVFLLTIGGGADG